MCSLATVGFGVTTLFTSAVLMSMEPRQRLKPWKKSALPRRSVTSMGFSLLFF